MKDHLIKFVRYIIITLFCLFSNAILAGAFQVLENDASSLGDFHSGAAADNSSVSSELYNPAILATLQQQQISLGSEVIFAQSIFKGTVTPLFGPMAITPPGGAASQVVSIVPNFHWALPLSKQFAFGLGIGSFYALGTNYGKSAPAGVLQAATFTQLITVDISPSLAYLITPHIAIGAGPDFIPAYADYNNLISLAGNNFNFTNNLQGQGFGYHLGMLILFSPQTRLGVSYRSAARLNLSGPSRFSGTGLYINNFATTSLPLPSLTILSFMHDFTQRFSAMASAYYTGWSIFNTLLLNNSALAGALGPALSTLPIAQNYKDSWTYAFGLHYWLTHKVMLKLGYAYDETPTQTGYRDIRLPDADRFYLASGLRVLASQNFNIDFGYAHVFFDKARVDTSQTSVHSGGILPVQLGYAKTNADVIGTQLTWKIAA